MADVANLNDIDDEEDEDEISDYSELFEDDLFGGSPVSKYWDIEGQIAEDSKQASFDDIIERMAVLEDLLSEHMDLENIDQLVKNYHFSEPEKLDRLKNGLYMELTGKLVFLLAD